MDRNSGILIVGGGIGGLTAALSLLRHGFAVRVFEQSHELREVGAGLTLSPGAVNCLEYLGLSAQVEARIARTNGFPFVHFRTGRLLSGSFATDEPDPAPRETGRGGHMFRGDLHTMLALAVQAIDPEAIVLNRRLCGFDQDGEGVNLRFSDGQVVRGRALLGCDGVRSVVRAGMLGDLAPAFTGRIAYRFLLPAKDALPFLQTTGPAAVFIGRSKTVNRYLIAGGQVLNFVGLSKTDVWSAEGWSHPATREELLAEFQGWHPDLLSLMAMAPADKLIRWGVFEHEPLDGWVDGRVALLGDAGHPMLPFLGLGAAMAIEDGVVLGRAFAEADSIEEAFGLYQASRISRTTKVFQGSRRQGEIFDTIDPDTYPPPDAPAHDRSFYDFDSRAPLGRR